MWTHNGKEFTLADIPEGCVGFVYLIANSVNGKLYVGKKLFWSSKRKSVNGKKKKIKVSSDWIDYFGSNGNLKQDVKDLGVSNFSREILHLCFSKSECSYFELKEQIERKAILAKNYYNDLIWVRINRNHLTRLRES